jgi:DNA repair protein RecN (Recombination protein N)
MITELNIKNFAIIDDLSIPFGPGLNVLTGETGAGKSIIIEALGAIMGDRASSDIIRSGQSEAEVVATFDSGRVSPELINRLKNAGYNIQNHLRLKRVVSTSKKSRAYLDGAPISLTDLKSISPFLLEISSQREHQRLLDEESHLEFVDKFGNLSKQCDEYKMSYEQYTNVRSKLLELERLSASKEEQRDFLSFQINEIDSAELLVGDEEKLEKERNVIKHAADLFSKLKESEQVLYSSEQSVSGSLSQVNQLIDSASKIDPEIGEWLPLTEQAIVATEEVSRNLQAYLEKLDVNPERIDEIEARLYDIRRLKKKYGGSVEDVLLQRDDLAKKLELIDNCDEHIKKLTSEERELGRALEKLAGKLSNARLVSADKLSEMTQSELNTLGLKKTTFAPGHVKLKFDQADESGIDRFSFLISPNPGEPLKPLSRIASGGELSRIMLAIKNVLLGKVGLAALEVFDEVDVGIGGANAEVVGKKLQEMSKQRQIICITHLPQVACFGDHHVVIAKEIVDQRTVTRFKLLNDANRENEIARMLGGVKITKATKEHAKDMLKRSAK